MGDAKSEIVSVREEPAFASINLGAEFRQGEILSDIIQRVYNPISDAIDTLNHQYVVIASQDCDLLQDFERRQRGDAPSLNGVLVFEARLASDARRIAGGSDIWKRVRQNKDERWHVLDGAPASFDVLGTGLPALAVDFKRFFTLSTTDLHHQCEGVPSRRRCRLEVPYREQFQIRAAHYLGRVAVPSPPKIE